MPRYKAVVAYDGTLFHGFQVQPGKRTVQGEIEKTLKMINNQEEIIIYGSGRTDAKVHALGQVIHFDYEAGRDAEKLRYALDQQTPADIAFLAVSEVANDFHARYHVQEKTYRFRVDIGKPRNPFTRNYASFYPFPLELEHIEEALPEFLGTHDFSAFCASGSSVEDKVRTIYEAEMVYDKELAELVFTFRGDGFLYKMVRNMVGTLLKIGNPRHKISAVSEILASGDRELAGPTAHPEGLYLVSVKYDEESEL